MRTGLTLPILFTFLFGFSMTSSAQSVVADQVLDHSSDWVNPQHVVDADPDQYGYLSSLLHLLKTSYLHVGFPVEGKAGDIVEVNVSSTGKTLGVDVFSSARLMVYDDKGNLLETVGEHELVQLALLQGPTEIYQLRFLTNVMESYQFKELRLEFQDLLAVNLLDEFRVHRISYVSTCPPVSATSVYAYKTAGPLSPSQVSNPQNAVDKDMALYATMEVPLNLLGIFPPAYLDLDFGAQRGHSGDFVGLTVSQASTLLSLGLLTNLSLHVYDEHQVLRETRDGFSLVDLKLLSGSTNLYTLGFVTQDDGYAISRVRVELKGVLHLLHSLRIHQAFHFSLDRPEVTVIADGPTEFCQGGFVNLQVVPSLEHESILWSTGARTPSIRVDQSGIYTVTVTNRLGCSSVSIPIKVTVSTDHQPEVKGDLTHNLCHGDDQGAIDIQVSGGSGHYTYQWAHGPSTKDLTGLAAGWYQLSVRDDLTGCEGLDSFEINQPDPLSVQFDILGDDTCTMEKDGSIEVLVSGGTAPYSLLWSHGDTSSFITDLDTGTYVLEVKDLHGCRDIWEAIVRRAACRDTTGGNDDDDDDDDDDNDDDDNPPGPGFDGFVIYEVITPNGDGANDTWEIKGLDQFPSSSIQVFNKWGDKVFDSQNYKNDWAGTRTNGDPLADGTYFYLIRVYPDPSSEGPRVFTGSLLIQR